MVVGRGVEVQLGVGHRLGRRRIVEHVLQVADPHVVGLDREVRAPEALLGEPQVAHRRRERQALVEAIVDLGALALQPGHLARLAVAGGAVDLGRQLPAARQVDVHPQQRLAGLSQDLSEPGGVGGVVPAITLLRPALSTNTSASSMFGSTPVPAVAASISGRSAATRAAVAITPPGLLVNSTCALPATARASKSAWREDTYANGSPDLRGTADPRQRQPRATPTAGDGDDHDDRAPHRRRARERRPRWRRTSPRCGSGWADR